MLNYGYLSYAWHVEQNNIKCLGVGHATGNKVSVCFGLISSPNQGQYILVLIITCPNQNKGVLCIENV